MPNFKQTCPQEHKFHGSFTHELNTYDVYTFATNIHFCLRFGDKPEQYAGPGNLEYILRYEMYSGSALTRKALKVAAKSDPEIRSLMSQHRLKLWNTACELDGLEPNSKVIVFSEHNRAARLAKELPI